jgi:hypothetical protein
MNAAWDAKGGAADLRAVRADQDVPALIPGEKMENTLAWAEGNGRGGLRRVSLQLVPRSPPPSLPASCAFARFLISRRTDSVSYVCLSVDAN